MSWCWIIFVNQHSLAKILAFALVTTCELYLNLQLSLLRQLFPSRCSIPVTQLQTGPVVLLVQICSQPPLSSSHQSDSKETSQVSHENPGKAFEFDWTAEGSAGDVNPVNLDSIILVFLNEPTGWKLCFYTFLIRLVRNQTKTCRSPLQTWTETLLTSPSYRSNSQYVLFMLTVLRVHSSLVWAVLYAQYTCINTADIVSSPRLLQVKSSLEVLTTLQTFVSESHRETSQWRWTSS